MAVRENLYLAYPDGAFRYDCRTCRGRCCKGPGLAFTPEELEAFPNPERLAMQARLLVGPYVYLDVGTSGCPCLGRSNLCSLALSSGKGAMPQLCRLFPFSRSVRIRRFLALHPHFDVCPLRLEFPLKPGPGRGHSDVDEALAGQPFSPFNQHEAVLPPGLSDDEVIRRETAFRDRCVEALAHRRTARAGRWALIGTEQHGAAAEVALTRLQIPWEPPHRAADALLISLAPSLRLGLLHLPEDRFGLALELWRRLLARAVTPRSRNASGAWTAVAPLTPAVGLLALDARSAFPQTPELPVPRFRQLRMTLAAAIVQRDLRSGRGMVTALERAMEDFASPAERVAFLIQLGQAFGTVAIV